MNLLFFVFCFLNLYGPISTNITFAFDIFLFVYVYGKTKKFISERGSYKQIPWLLLMISILSVLFTRDHDTDYSVIGTYLRMLVNCILFPSMIVFFLKKKVDVLKILSWTLFLHCLMVLLQLAVPSLQEINSVLFRFERENDLLADYTFRRLGLAGGFDLSALFATLSVVIALEDYLINSRRLSLLVFLISFLASLFTSRTGMSVSAISVVVCVYLNRGRMKDSVKVMTLMILSIAFIAAIYFILPIVLSSFDIDYGRKLSGFEDQYAVETYDYLSNYQLDPLFSLTTRELFFGYGCGVQKADMLYYSSDIGYVKQIYQIGVVGVCLILYFCISCVLKIYKRYKLCSCDRMVRMGNQLMWLFLLIYIVFNYKNHLMYSVCSFEVFLIVYWMVYYYARESHKTKRVSC